MTFYKAAGLTLLTLPTLLYAVESGSDSQTLSADDIRLDDQVVVGRAPLLGEASSASEGYVTQAAIEIRPMLRTGEVLELVPGMVVTQHSGTGTANQYFLRGFNLDHGTDFSTSIDGMPVNMRTHGHGQGYTDLNFIIPETIESLRYQKGSYYAETGDFSGAGSASLHTVRKLDRNEAELTLGQNAYQRALLMGSVEKGSGDWLYAIERNTYDGPWTDIEENLDKTNLLLSYSQPLAGGKWRLSLMGYDNSWNSADQIPERAVTSGQIDELGSIDDTVGGESSRYSINTEWSNGAWEASAYAIRYNMNLWSNFTYFLDDPVNGDQFEQVDHRNIYGGKLAYQWQDKLAGRTMVNRVGTEFRYDDINEVGLYQSQARERIGVVRSDEVGEFSTGVFAENTLYWNSRLRSVLGLRYDFYHFDVDNRTDINKNGVDLSANSRKASAGNTSLKASLIYQLSPEWETYIAAGQGFHSNDARGTTIEIDPADGSDATQVDPLVDSLGYEVGVRGFVNQRLNTSVSLWQLDLDSELLFVGDAGNTEASDASRRRGIELTAYYRITDVWNFDAEYAHTQAEFTDSGDDIPGAIEDVLQTGVSADFGNGWSGAARVRHFGERPLIEDGSVKSDASTVVNLQAGYSQANWSVRGEVLNLLDSDDHDIDYLYESQLPGESEPVEDIHYHVLEPRTVRVSLAYHF
ncbi:MAG: TonB-dependent receptor [Pseudomonadota bacterium]|nr:TonB-dependent receptor [Pseudomonadota bacterium]